jgi:hydrogenase maturation factor
VIVHVGFAISKVDESEAAEILSYLQQIDLALPKKGDSPLEE